MFKSLALIEDVSSPGKPLNEDAFGISGAYAWIIDGATGTGETEYLPPTGAAWLARTLSESLSGAIAAKPSIGLDELLREIEAAIAARFDAAIEHLAEPEPADIPSACLGILHLDGDRLELACIGDVSLIGRNSAGAIEAFSDRSTERFGARTLHFLDAIRRRDPDSDPWPRLRRIIRRNRRMMNRDGGYFVVHPRLPWRTHVMRETRAVWPGETWLLASDGLTRLMDLFGAYDAAALYHQAQERGLAALVTELRGLENADAEGSRFVRVKRHDDATGLIVRVE